MFVIGAGACLVLASFFGGGDAGVVGAILLIALEAFLLVQSIRR